MKRAVTVVLFVGAALLGVRFQTLHAEDDTALLKQAQILFSPLPQASGPEAPTSAAQEALGKMLFFDPRWTVEGNVSCATCHQPALYGTDALPKSIGVQHRTHQRNAPTVLNAGLNFVQHWTGDRKDLEDQAVKALGGAFSSGHRDAAAAV